MQAVKMETEVQGINIYYEIIGEGRPIVMLHGGYVDHRQMVGDLEPLFAKRSNWKRIYPDLPGHGRTLAKDWIVNQEQVLELVLGFIDKIIPGQTFTLAGQSRGGYLARGIIYARPEAVDGVLLIVPARYAVAPASSLSPHVTLVRDESVFGKLKPAETETFEMLVVQSHKALDKLRADFYPAFELSDADFQNRIMQHYEFSFDVDRLSLPFEKPSLIIVGRQDDSVGYRDAWRMIDQFPRATFAVLDKAGHLLPLEQEGLFRVLTDEWLQRVEEYVG
jgi:pimeloyl-ACP methyl ester carboxylesterase